MNKGENLRAIDYVGHIAQAIDRIHRYVEDMTELTIGMPTKKFVARLR